MGTLTPREEGREGFHGKTPPPFGVVQRKYCESERYAGKVAANRSVMRVCDLRLLKSIPQNTEGKRKKQIGLWRPGDPCLKVNFQQSGRKEIDRSLRLGVSRTAEDAAPRAGPAPCGGELTLHPTDPIGGFHER